MAWKIGSLEKGKVLDMPLITKYHNPDTDIFTDKTPYCNHGANNGADVDTDHSTFIAANSDYVRIPDSPSLSPVDAMTAMIWMKGAVQSGMVIYSHYDYQINQRSFMIRNSNVYFSAIISDDGTTGTGHFKTYTSSIAVYDSAWHKIGFTFNAGTLKLFIDGIEDTNPTKNFDGAITTIHDSTADIMLGCDLTSDTPTTFFTGDLARPRMWNRALTPTEWALAFDQEVGLYL